MPRVRFRHSRLTLAALLAGLVGVLGAETALAQSEEDNPIIRQRAEQARAVFGSIDLNGDGQVDEQESLFSRRRTFVDLDVDRDGFLTPGEYVAFVARDRRATEDPDDDLTFLQLQRQIRRQYHRLDRNVDGLVSEAEYMAPSYWFIARYDRDGDAIVTEEEYVGDRTFQFPPRFGGAARPQ